MWRTVPEAEATTSKKHPSGTRYTAVAHTTVPAKGGLTNCFYIDLEASDSLILSRGDLHAYRELCLSDRAQGHDPKVSGADGQRQEHRTDSPGACGTSQWGCYDRYGKGRTMHHDLGLPKSLWAEAFQDSNVHSQ